MQIVIGLLCAGEGIPVAVEVFNENTPYTRTLEAQIAKLSGRFGRCRVVLMAAGGCLRRPGCGKTCARWKAWSGSPR